jgi:hypothetical protein
MMDDLERRERQVASEKSEEEQARARLKVGGRRWVAIGNRCWAMGDGLMA